MPSSPRRYTVNGQRSQHIIFSNGDNESGNSSWQRLIQLCEYCWIPSSAVVGLSFVFPDETDNVSMLSHAFDDCRGMFKAYLLKHRKDSAGLISCIPPDSCPPFPSCLEDFRKQWSVDHCQLIFNSIYQICQDMQRNLCRVAQSQGDFSIKTTKLQVPNCCWFYIKSNLSIRGIHSVTPVRYTQPKSVLSWGLTLCSCPYIGILDVLRFDTREKIRVFRQVFGVMAGVGIRKRRPKYVDGTSLLSDNNVLNIIMCRDLNDLTITPADSTSSHETFKRFGSTDDGIDLAYDSSQGLLQIVLRYRKMVVTNSSIHALSSLGVVLPNYSTSANHGTVTSLDENSSTEDDEETEIVPGMEFVDGMYVMQVWQVYPHEVHAKQQSGL